MRHAYIRAIGGLLWLAAAIASGITGSFATAILYLALSAVFLRFSPSKTFAPGTIVKPLCCRAFRWRSWSGKPWG